MSKTSVLDRYSRRFKKLVDKKEDVDPFERYKLSLEDKDVVQVKFTLADPDGSLYFTDRNGIKCMITSEDLSYALDYYEPYMKSQFLNKEFYVTIKEVDEENGRVYFRSARSNRNATSARIISDISNALESGKHPEVYGKVNRTTDDMVYVDIFEKGILGMCTIHDWRKGYIQRLADEAKVGMVLPFIVKDAAKPKKKVTARKAFMLSRFELTRDPWEEISPEIEEGSVILVKCLERPPKTTWWWGRTDSAPEIPVKGEYNSRLQVRQGLTYKCKVTKLDKDNRMFQAVPFDVTDFESEEVEENYKIITRGKGVRQKTDLKASDTDAKAKVEEKPDVSENAEGAKSTESKGEKGVTKKADVASDDKKETKAKKSKTKRATKKDGE